MKTDGLTLPACVQIETKKNSPNIFKKLVHGASRCNSHTVVCNLNTVAHLNLKFGVGGGVGGGVSILYTKFFSVKNTTPRGVGGSILYMIPLSTFGRNRCLF